MIFVHIWWWLQKFFGASNTAGVAYGFWSGSVSDIGEVVLLGALIGVYKHHNCAIPRCPRIAHKKFEVKETHQYTCHHHATPYWHDLLLQQYKEDYPEQHRLINRERYER